MAAELRAIAIDWSGRARGDAEHIWLAEARSGRLVDLCNGMSRACVIDEVLARAGEHPRTAVGLDFAFSFPRWWCEQNGWATARDVWRAAAADGDRWLAECPAPFWGRRARHAGVRDVQYRRTDERARPAKSVFQIAGAGAVGTGSIRGMPHLLTLDRAGFSVWPFDPPGWPRVVEIYPRLLTGPVRKGRWRERHAHLARSFAGQDEALLERAAGSEDAFDAAVSAIRMSERAAALERLPRARDREERIEGRIWCA